MRCLVATIRREVFLSQIRSGGFRVERLTCLASSAVLHLNQVMKKDIREAMRNAISGWQLILDLPCFKAEEARAHEKDQWRSALRWPVKGSSLLSKIYVRAIASGVEATSSLFFTVCIR